MSWRKPWTTPVDLYQLFQKPVRNRFFALFCFLTPPDSTMALALQEK